MGVVIAVVVVLGVGIFGMTAQHSKISEQNKALKAQVVTLKQNQVPVVKKLDGIEIKNLANKDKTSGDK